MSGKVLFPPKKNISNISSFVLPGNGARTLVCQNSSFSSSEYDDIYNDGDDIYNDIDDDIDNDSEDDDDIDDHIL